MTFIKTRLHLASMPTSNDAKKLSRLSTLYGIRGFSIDGRDLVLEYDASRLHEAEVLAAVRRTGIAAEPAQRMPLGGFDHTGEFKDYAWPTTGLSPANAKQK